MKIAGIIPARWASTRFPGKPLAEIGGKTMIRRVYEQCLKCDALTRVIVATDDERIAGEVEGFGGTVLMTSPHHTSGTERCCETVELLEQRGENFEAVINIQGDEPFIDPQQIMQVALLLQKSNAGIATLIKKIDAPEMLSNPNVVKVVVANDGKALYFSRAAIPFMRNGKDEKPENHLFYRHVGIYGYRTEVLKKLVSLPEGLLEQAEKLEQLRWLEHGFSVFTGITDFESIAVDTPEDLSKIFNK